MNRASKTQRQVVRMLVFISLKDVEEKSSRPLASDAPGRCSDSEFSFAEEC